MELQELKNNISIPNWNRGITQSNNVQKKLLLLTLLNKTNFLSENSALSARAWHVLNDNYVIQKCLTCGNPVKWDKSYRKYPQYCSNKCTANSILTKEKKKQISLKKYGTECSFLNLEQKIKRQKTIKEKYGVEHVSQADCVKEKKKQTNLKNYGVEYALQRKEIHEQKNITVKEKYGVEYISQLPEIKEKIKATNLERHGSECYLTSPNFKKLYTKISKEKFGTDCPMHNPKIKEKVKVTNRIKYDRDFAIQKHIPKQILRLLNNKKWLIQQHHIRKIDILSIAESLNVCGSTVARKCKQFGIEIKRYYTSSLEKEVRIFLEENINLEMVYCNRKIIDKNLELDIYIPNKNIAIEFNGLFWHSEYQMDDNYHKMKYELCKKKGIRLIQIFEDEWVENKELVKKKLLHILELSQEKKIYARKCEIKTLQQHEKKEFFNKTHIQGDGSSSLNCGLFYENNPVAAIGFIKQQNNEYILNRYSTNANVIGGFTKLLNHFERTLKPFKIITFADLRWSQGNLYEKSGFSLDKILKPDYFWIKRDKRFHKSNFKHIVLSDKLKNYDPTLSESENMHNNNWWKIYDAGKLRFIKIYE